MLLFTLKKANTIIVHTSSSSSTSSSSLNKKGKIEDFNSKQNETLTNTNVSQNQKSTMLSSSLSPIMCSTLTNDETLNRSERVVDEPFKSTIYSHQKDTKKYAIEMETKTMDKSEEAAVPQLKNKNKNTSFPSLLPLPSSEHKNKEKNLLDLVKELDDKKSNQDDGNLNFKNESVPSLSREKPKENKPKCETSQYQSNYFSKNETTNDASEDIIKVAEKLDQELRGKCWLKSSKSKEFLQNRNTIADHFETRKSQEMIYDHKNNVQLEQSVPQTPPPKPPRTSLLPKSPPPPPLPPKPSQLKPTGQVHGLLSPTTISTPTPIKKHAPMPPQLPPRPAPMPTFNNLDMKSFTKEFGVINHFPELMNEENESRMSRLTKELHNFAFHLFYSLTKNENTMNRSKYICID